MKLSMNCPQVAARSSNLLDFPLPGPTEPLASLENINPYTALDKPRVNALTTLPSPQLTTPVANGQQEKLRHQQEPTEQEQGSVPHQFGTIPAGELVQAESFSRRQRPKSMDARPRPAAVRSHMQQGPGRQQAVEDSTGAGHRFAVMRHSLEVMHARNALLGSGGNNVRYVGQRCCLDWVMMIWCGSTTNELVLCHNC